MLELMPDRLSQPLVNVSPEAGPERRNDRSVEDILDVPFFFSGGEILNVPFPPVWCSL
jgi:hypothetical protein